MNFRSHLYVQACHDNWEKKTQMPSSYLHSMIQMIGVALHINFIPLIFPVERAQPFVNLTCLTSGLILKLRIKICWKCAYRQAIQDVEEFVSSSDLEKCSITSLAHQWILCSEWVPSEWESKQLIKTSQ